MLFRLKSVHQEPFYLNVGEELVCREPFCLVNNPRVSSSSSTSEPSSWSTTLCFVLIIYIWTVYLVNNPRVSSLLSTSEPSTWSTTLGFRPHHLHLNVREDNSTWSTTLGFRPHHLHLNVREDPSTWSTTLGFRPYHLHLNVREDLQSQTRHDLPGEYKMTKSTSRACGCLLLAAEQTIIVKIDCEQENTFCINYHIHYYLHVMKKSKPDSMPCGWGAHLCRVQFPA